MWSYAFAQCEPNAVAFALNPKTFPGQNSAEVSRDLIFVTRDARYRNEKLEELYSVHELNSEGAFSTNIVPLPSFVKTSARIESERMPETKCTLVTPAPSAETAAAIFGRIPVWIAPEASSSPIFARSTKGSRLCGFSGSESTPGSFKTKNNFSTLSAAAIAAATESAFVLRICCVPSAVKGATTGT